VERFLANSKWPHLAHVRLVGLQTAKPTTVFAVLEYAAAVAASPQVGSSETQRDNIKAVAV
jgi:hypothetical protein